MMETKRMVTLDEDPPTLIGNEIKAGLIAPDSQIVDQDFKPFYLSDIKCKICIIFSITSFDTPVCDIETRRFNEVSANLSSDIEILIISRGLPFAHKRWC